MPDLPYCVYDAFTHERLPGVPSPTLIDTGGKVVYARHSTALGVWVRWHGDMEDAVRQGVEVWAVYVL